MQLLGQAELLKEAPTSTVNRGSTPAHNAPCEEIKALEGQGLLLSAAENSKINGLKDASFGRRIRTERQGGERDIDNEESRTFAPWQP